MFLREEELWERKNNLPGSWNSAVLQLLVLRMQQAANPGGILNKKVVLTA